jgi:hypothetical protein
VTPRVKPGAREAGEVVKIKPTSSEIVTVGPVTTKDDGSESFTVTMSDPDDTLGASGGISAPLGLLAKHLLAESKVLTPRRTIFPKFTVPRGELHFVTPGRGPLMGEAAERWYQEQEREGRERARERMIEENFCLCGHHNVGYDDNYEADWRRVRPSGGFCPVHGTTDELDHWDDD